ncbi:SacI homology domain-containing protein [Thermothelomyces heterothallicus CBS 202.75]|uniref:SacI homology domain-containing protein n=1 Tax=Thermothelomyces heterothallicus CBS 202.75 TaxID=1149848 RepID=UPI0037436B13
MPGLARKIIICAAVDGLVLHPLNARKDSHQRSAALPPVRIKYGDASISPIPRDAAPDPSSLPPNSSFEAFGIVGLVTVFHYSYLISITRRQQVASIRGLPVYVVTEVALTPCTSQHEAAEAIARTAASLRGRRESLEDGDDGSADASTAAASADEEGILSGSDERGGDEVGGRDDAGEVMSDTEAATAGPTTGSAAGAASDGRRSSVVQDVIGKRGSYGRFAQRWFSRSGWAMDQKRMMGLSADDRAAPRGSGDSSSKGEGKASGEAAKLGAASGTGGTAAAISLLPKLLRTSQILFGSSKTFYFAYDHDITRSMTNPKVPETPLVPLHEHVEQTYFWNRSIIQPFIDAGVDSLALPLMQGFVGQRTFVVDSNPPQDDGAYKDSVELSDFSSSRAASPSPADKASADMRPTEKRFDITLISRRSIKRAGLRYLRRGIDEEGNVANSVESEQILSPADAAWDPNAKVYSFVQTRGSIPLFFTQSPYSLKPVPVMQHSPESNFAALKKHFEGLRKRYGSVQVVNLVEKHGVEAPIAEVYEKNIQQLNEEAGPGADKVEFEWFDFHDVCRGMKFENVSFLLQTLGGQLERFGSSVSVNDRLETRQKGVLRTNCMDCLDRTNVCQSSFAKYMLDLQLKEEGFDMAAQKDQENVWFNTLWADNGDAISKQYASTGAMKGDYTRTRKRNYRGALTDAGLSLTRLFNGMFNDFFLQASIDFLLGNVTSLVFEEFEATMMTKDPAVSMQNMRQQAIELCQKRVVADEDEEFVGGWTLLTPHVPDTVRSASMEEAVLLLTDVALYLCRFDWNLDKVSSFDRVDLAHVQKIKLGTYITSTISPAQTDDTRNVGLVIEYRPGLTDITRVNTRSLSSMSSSTAQARGSEEGGAPTAAAAAARDAGSAPAASGLAGLLSRRPQTAAPRKIALKALHSQTSAADTSSRSMQDEPGAITRLTEIQQVLLIAAEIERLAIRNQPRLAGKSPEEAGLVEKGDIISLAEAKKNTTLLEQLGHSIKKLVWA